MLDDSEYLRQGTTLKRRYQIIKLLGEGSFGQTYLAEDTYETDSQGTVVIKRLKSHKNNQVFEVARKKFIAEAFTLRKVGYKHSQIPTLLDFFYKEDEFFLVQEYIQGINLATRLNLNLEFRQRVIFSETEAINLLTQLLDILKCLHENQTIHLDIKPLNIIWRKKDNKYFLIDFGCVTDTSEYNLINEPSFSSAILGTPHYMPKEQSMGNPHYNSDIYALGIVVIQAVTGLNCMDFKYDNYGKLIWEDKANISEELKTILNKMIQVEYKIYYRYQKATEILEDLKVSKPKKLTRIINKLLPISKEIIHFQYFKLLILLLTTSFLLGAIWEIWLRPKNREKSTPIKTQILRQ